MISLGSKLGWLALGVASAFTGCGKSGDEPGNIAGAPAHFDAGAGEAGAPNILIVPEAGGTENAGSSAGAGGLPTPPAVDCGQAGGDSAGAGGAIEECAPPASVCADDDRRLVYYSSGVCVAGACRWTATTLDCPGYCRNGYCMESTTQK
ncbi:MAG TPA: hypothetical protein VGJ91_05760 [Polyangiaceae bacterium]